LSQRARHALHERRQDLAVPLATLLTLLAPPLCWSCHAPAPRGSALCRDCRGRLRFLVRDEFLPDSGRNSSHALRPPVPRVWAAVAYEGPARSLVAAVKFHGATAVAAQLAALIVANAPPGLLAGTLVAVPLHPARRRARGFNQAALIADALAARTGLPRADVLHRAGPDIRQVGRDRAARLRGPPGSMRADGPVPARALLVDDVVTTGATLAACAGALRAAGSERVAGVAFARTVGR
jgi:predicted amidophosphoribosyltransferase